MSSLREEIKGAEKAKVEGYHQSAPEKERLKDLIGKLKYLPPCAADYFFIWK